MVDDLYGTFFRIKAVLGAFFQYEYLVQVLPTITNTLPECVSTEYSEYWSTRVGVTSFESSTSSTVVVSTVTRTTYR
jgi:hypothetical protein